MCVNKLETMYGRSDVNVKVERGSTFTFTRGFSYIVSILFTHVKPVKSLRPYACKNYATVFRSQQMVPDYLPKGGFPLSRNFYVRTDVNFNWLYVRK